MRIPVGIVSALLLISFSATAQQYTINTLAGGAPPPNNGNAQSVALGGLGAVASDPNGNIYFVVSNSVFMNQGGALVRIAGTSRIVKLGISAPRTVLVLRDELKRTADFNREASRSIPANEVAKLAAAFAESQRSHGSAVPRNPSKESSR